MLLLTRKGEVLNVQISGSIAGTRLDAIVIFMSDVIGYDIDGFNRALNEQFFTRFKPYNRYYVSAAQRAGSRGYW